MAKKKELFWVLGDTEKGFSVVTKKPRTKVVPEPFESYEATQRWIACQYMLRD